MKYTIVNNMRISQLTLGTAQLGFHYGVANTRGKLDRKNAREILKSATDHGITCFDTAPTYGDSEKEIGSFLTYYQPILEIPLIVSKLPAVNLGVEATSNSMYSWVKDNVIKSIDKLHIKSIPIYLLHRASDMYSNNGLVIESLLKLHDEGLIGLVGISVYTPEEVEMVLNVKVIKAIQLPINIFDHRLIKTGLLNRIVDRDVVVFVRSVFLQGLFFLDVDKLPIGLEQAKEPLIKLHQLSQKWEIDIAQIALCFVRDLPGINSIVIGAETTDQVINNINLLCAMPLPPDLKTEIMTVFSNLPPTLINPSLWNYTSTH